MSAEAVRDVLDGLNDVIGLGWIDQNIGTEILRTREPFRADIEGDYPRAHRTRELRCRQADRSLTEDCNGLITAQAETLERAPCRASAA